MSKPFIITIDGPAASGKSTISRLVAKKLGGHWVSTGIFYRGIAYMAVQQGLDLNDTRALEGLVADKGWRVELAEDTQFYIGGHDVTSELQKESIGNVASQVSQCQELRSALVQAQRDCAAGRKLLVAEGRDCGTAVFPEADVKVFLTASDRDRASRRATEQGQSVESIFQMQAERDQADSRRKASPMRAAETAITIDSSKLPIEEVLSLVLREVQAQGYAPNRAKDELKS